MRPTILMGFGLLASSCISSNGHPGDPEGIDPGAQGEVQEEPKKRDEVELAKPVSAPSATADTAPSGVKILRSEGTVLDAYRALTRTFSADEGLPGVIACEPGRVPWLAGGRAASGGFAICLPEDPPDGLHESPIVVSLSRPAPLGPRAPGPALELIHQWWMGSGRAQVAIKGDRVHVSAEVTLGHRTHPASITGGTPDAPVKVDGAATLTR